MYILNTIESNTNAFEKCDLCKRNIYHNSKTIIFNKSCECNLSFHDVCFLDWINRFDCCYNCNRKMGCEFVSPKKLRKKRCLFRFYSIFCR